MFSAIQERDSELKEIISQFFPHLKEGNDRNPESGIDYKGTLKWDGDIQKLPVQDRIKALIQYDPGKGTRSNGIMSVVNALVKGGVKRADIFNIFKEHPIGIKWRKEHKSQSKWLDRHIDKARSRTSTSKVKPQGVANNTSASSSKTFPLTDSGAAERFVDEYGGIIRHCPSMGWMKNDEERGVWEVNEPGIYALGKQTARTLFRRAAELQDDTQREILVKYALKLESRSKLEAMIFLAAREPSICIKPGEFDADPWLFNFPNGTINLKTGEFYPHRRSDLITKIAPVRIDPKATCHLWRDSLNRYFGGNISMISFLQRAVGYSMTGDVREQCLFFLYGLGANGKSTFLETIRAAFGDYVKQTDFSTFLEKKNDGGVRNDLAALRGARFVSGVEVESGKRLAEVLVKQVTGGDTISARFLHREFFEFKPTFKLWLAANHKPIIRASDHAMWRRIRIIPFSVTIPEDERDPDILNKLKCELPGILNWAIEGCAEWQEKGLGVPEEVKEATREYREEMDVFGGFLTEHCILEPDLMIRTKDIYEKYTEWCQANGDEPLKKRTFGLKLRERGLKDHRIGPKQDRGWLGVGLQTQYLDRHNQTQPALFPYSENDLNQKYSSMCLNVSDGSNVSENHITCSSCANFQPNGSNPTFQGHCLGTPPDENKSRFPNLEIDCPEFRERESGAACGS